MPENPLLIILGPTASGKTQLGVRLADTLGGEIISADSRQVFKGMDIGTGKDLKEYNLNGKTIPYHLIDIKNAGEHYNVNEFKEDFYSVFEEITNRAVLPVLCGGTGMYVHNVLQNYHYTAVPVNEPLRSRLIDLEIGRLRNVLKRYPPEYVSHADLSSHKRLIRAIEIAEYLSGNHLVIKERPKLNTFVAGLTSDTSMRRSRIINRLNQRLEAGMIDEVKWLIDQGISRHMFTFYGLEYKFIAAYLFNELSYSALVDQLSTAICQFAKRQMTFFRKMEKDGVKINWFSIEEGSDVLYFKVLESVNDWKTSSD